MTAERWRQVEEIYHAARERGRGVLDGADAELRAEVESLLAQDVSREGMLDNPPVAGTGLPNEGRRGATAFEPLGTTKINF